jgi:hypothetical protein
VKAFSLLAMPCDPVPPIAEPKKHPGDEIDQFFSTFVHRDDNLSSSSYLCLLVLIPDRTDFPPSRVLLLLTCRISQPNICANG